MINAPLPTAWRRRNTTEPRHTARFSTEGGLLSVTIDDYPSPDPRPGITCAVFDQSEVKVKVLAAGTGCGMEITTDHTSIMLVLPCTVEELAGMVFADVLDGAS